MTVSRQVLEAMKRGSFIRKMFEEGRQLKEQYGEENVYDFSIGNPDLPPPAEFQRVLQEEAARDEPGLHGYMPNAGFEETRRALAESYRAATGLPFRFGDITMTSGAGGALNVVLKAILDPGDEVIVLAPFFVEYGFYVSNHQGRMVISETDENFQPDPVDLESRLTERTRAVVINSPNNPTGVVYPPAVLSKLGDLLRSASQRFGRTVYLLSDEPYREIIFDGMSYPSPFLHYENTVVVTSNSKDLSLAGERIGHAAISPESTERSSIADALVFCNRILGFVNANALMQRVVARLQGVSVDRSVYQRRRDILCEALSEMGYRFTKPGGAFYLFPESPLPDDGKFADFMRNFRVIVVPGSGFFRSGHFRISYAVKEKTIENSLEYFRKAAKQLGL